MSCISCWRFLTWAFFEIERLASQWTALHLGCHAFLVSVQGVVRMVAVLGKKKFEFLDTVPYLLSRLREPGIRDRCLAQFAEAPAAKHDKVSIYMLEPTSKFGRMVRALNSDGTSMDPLLGDEVDSIGSTLCVAWLSYGINVVQLKRCRCTRCVLGIALLCCIACVVYCLLHACTWLLYDSCWSVFVFRLFFWSCMECLLWDGVPLMFVAFGFQRVVVCWCLGFVVVHV